MASKRRRGDGTSGVGGDSKSGSASGAGGSSSAVSAAGGPLPSAAGATAAGAGRGSPTAAGAGRGSPTAAGAGRGSPTAAGSAGRGSPASGGAGRGSPASGGAGRGSPAAADAGRGSPVTTGSGRGSTAARGSGGEKKYSIDRRVTRSVSSGSGRQTRSAGNTPELSVGPPKRGSSSKGKGKAKVKVEESSDEEAAGDAGGDDAAKTLVIEHYLKSPSTDFKKQAADFKKLLQTAIPDARVLINPEKKVTGFFTIRELGGNEETFLNLSDMAKPFQELESLNKGSVVENIVKRLNDNNRLNDDDNSQSDDE
uniref:Uncharacterized protein n=1 Tax=Kalanchoe fedtschenkoi TaxID=63787 RepID=A0A7N0UM24_KALFE